MQAHATDELVSQTYLVSVFAVPADLVASELPLQECLDRGGLDATSSLWDPEQVCRLVPATRVLALQSMHAGLACCCLEADEQADNATAQPGSLRVQQDSVHWGLSMPIGSGRSIQRQKACVREASAACASCLGQPELHADRTAVAVVCQRAAGASAGQGGLCQSPARHLACQDCCRQGALPIIMC